MKNLLCLVLLHVPILYSMDNNNQVATAAEAIFPSNYEKYSSEWWDCLSDWAKAYCNSKYILSARCQRNGQIIEYGGQNKEILKTFCDWLFKKLKNNIGDPNAEFELSPCLSYPLLSKAFFYEQENYYLALLLLKGCANPNMNFAAHSRPYLFSAKTKKWAQMLIQHGANVNVIDIINPLQNACNDENYSEELVKFYIDNGSDNDYSSHLGNALHWLASNPKNYNNLSRMFAKAQYLIEANASLNSINKGGRTALDTVNWLINSEKENKQFISFRNFLIAQGAKTAQELKNQNDAEKNELQIALLKIIE